MKNARPSDRLRHDRWLVSYADLMTILLACFATTFAAARTPASVPLPSPPPAAREVTAPAIAAGARPAPPTLRDVVAPVVAASASNAIAFVDDARGVVIALPESASFATGSATLALPARTFLLNLARALRATNALVRIEGHTDDVPVSGGRYGSNWELSTARASAVVAFLVGDAAFAPERLSAAGYAEFHPRVANDSPETRARNRRVDVVLLDPARP
jgi:chemotaxis protein MotB